MKKLILAEAIIIIAAVGIFALMLYIGIESCLAALIPVPVLAISMILLPCVPRQHCFIGDTFVYTPIVSILFVYIFFGVFTIAPTAISLKCFILTLIASIIGIIFATCMVINLSSDIEKEEKIKKRKIVISLIIEVAVILGGFQLVMLFI